MIKKDLLAMRALNATPTMFKLAREDKPQKRPGICGTEFRKYSEYARCRVEDGILKVALFFADSLRAGASKPSYEVFIDHANKRFITYDRIEEKWRTAKVDRLNWPYHISATDGTWMSPVDKKTVQAYLCTEKDGCDSVLEYQEMLRKAALVRYHKKVTDPWDADLNPTPDVPKDWDRWVKKIGIPQNFMFYRYRKQGAKEGHCTYCEKDVPLTKKPQHNKEGHCPVCHRLITYKSIGKMAYRVSTGINCVYLFQQRPDGFIVREFWAERIYTKDTWATERVECNERLRSIYDSKLNVRHYYWGWFKNKECRWIAGVPNNSWYSPESSYYTHGNKPGRVYGKGLSHLVQALLPRSGLLDYLRGNHMTVNPDDYLYTLKKTTCLEQLSKANLPRLASECVHDPNLLKDAFSGPQGRGLAKALSIDGQRLGRLRQYNGGGTFLYWLQWEKQQDTIWADTVIQSLSSWRIRPRDLSFILDRMSPLQVCNYLKKQMSASGESAWDVLTTWKDYLSMAERLKLDTNDEIIYRARLLYKRHDELVMRCRRKANEPWAKEVLKKFPKVDEICHSIKEKYEYQNKDFAVIVPNGALDIIMEGNALNHCVGNQDSYWDRIQQKETFILFLRKASSPEVPYYTLEVEPDGSVRQKRSKFNRVDSSEKSVTKFLKTWQKVIARRLTEDDRKAAAMSKVLREQEFEQLRKDNVIIRAGGLSGQRLVDVLIADLMENAA